MKRSGEWTLWLGLCICWACCNVWAYEVEEIRCQSKLNPVGVGRTPQFSWTLSSDQRCQIQSAYHIRVANCPENLSNEQGPCWDSGKVTSSQTLHVPYQGSPLKSGTCYYWQVQSWNQDDQATGWSLTGQFTTALFDPNDWNNAQWIGYEEIDESEILLPGVSPWGRNVRELAKRRPVVPLLRKSFEIDAPVQRVLLFISGLGHYQASLNGKDVDNDFLNPGWTDYRKLCLYNTYDITTRVVTGDNSVGVIVGPGFYNVNNERYRKLLITYGMPKVKAMIKILYNDGREEFVVTDTTWKTTPSPITYSSMYGGEDYDARLEQEGWNRPGFDDSTWPSALWVRDPGGNLQSQTTYPLRVREIFNPRQRIQLTEDRWLYDFGQNASGIVRIKVKGQKGQVITIRPGELIKEDHSINQRATGSPYYYQYTLKGDGIETWQPRFTYYGMRYVQIEGVTPSDDIQDSNLPQLVESQLLHTFNGTPRVGYFECSHDLFNRINRLILYAIQSNTQSVSTDCPHREKLGWLEQTFLMGSSIHYNLDLYHLYRQTVANMQAAQYSDGMVPNIAPEYVYFGGDFTDSPEWGSASIILPWLIHQWYGDSSVMTEAWPMMEHYLSYLQGKAENHILTHGLGDWYDQGPERPGYSQLTPKGVTATALYYYDAHLMARMAALLDKSEEQQKYVQLAVEIKKAFNDKFFDRHTGLYASGSQTSLAMPLCLGLVPEDQIQRVQQNLIETIKQNDKALTAGDIGFHYLVEALTQADADTLLYEMNNRDDVPGYGYQLKKGATALTESWAGLEIVSNNHLMLGHLMQWFYDGLAGIQQASDSVAYQNILIAPAFLKGFDHVKASYRCPYGLIRSQWTRANEGLTLNVTIPVNTTASILLPTDEVARIQESDKPLDLPWQKIQDKQLSVQVGSGSYQFKITP